MSTPAMHPLSEKEFFSLLEGKNPAFILGTSSADKRSKYATLFNALDNGEKSGKKGIDGIFTHTGALGITPGYIPEKEGDYARHALLKVNALTRTLTERERSIRARLQGSGMTEQEAEATMLVGMTEDSGWEVILTDAEKKPFLDKVTELLAERFRPEDKAWLFNHITDSFPGPNLKPFQEYLPGGFNELMEVVYAASESIGMRELRYRTDIQVAFGIRGENLENHVFTKHFDASGDIISLKEFHRLIENLPEGMALNTDSVQIPDGQTVDRPESFAQLRERSFSTHSTTLPFSFARRQCAEWLQDRLGVQPQTQQHQEIHIAYVSPSEFEGEERTLPEATTSLLSGIAGKDFRIASIPTRDELRNHPGRRLLNGSDIIVLRPEPVVEKDGLIYDPNLLLADYIGVSVLTDPLSMGTPVILDNRSGQFRHTLEVFRHGFQTGRFMGEFPFLVAESDEALQHLLHQEVDNLGSVIIRSDDAPAPTEDTDPSRSLDLIPDDGTLSVLVAGGHHNNNRQDLEEAEAFGHFLASQGIRIVTGGGQVEGSMGATHTGFIRFHLDRLKENSSAMRTLESSEREVLFRLAAEELILQHPGLVNKLADLGHIPRDMFYAYSTQPLIDMESPNRQWPAATLYQDTGNRVRRLDGLMSTGTKVFFPGAIGTDEEIVHAFKQVMEERRQAPAANDNSPYSDGTPERQGKIILYNREIMQPRSHETGGLTLQPTGIFDGILQTYGLMNADRSLNTDVMETYGIEVISTLEAAKGTIRDRLVKTVSWRDRLTRQQENQTENISRQA